MKNAVLFALLAFAILAPVSAIADTWGDQINDPTRFVVLPGYGGAAVLDQETGLVWEQSPDPGTPPGTAVLSWLAAQASCLQKAVGNRKGWRVPTIQELASLVDQTQGNPTLPAGHPFSNVQPFGYWSATSRAAISGEAWAVFFGDGALFPATKSSVSFVWCVRGGHGVDPQ